MKSTRSKVGSFISPAPMRHVIARGVRLLHDSGRYRLARGNGVLSVFDLVVKDRTGNEMSLAHFTGQVLLIVNTAFRYGMKPKFEELEELQRRYYNDGLRVLGFPTSDFGGSANGSEEWAAEALASVVTFPLFATIKVTGPERDPLFTYLASAPRGAEVTGDFDKFLVNRRGEVIEHYSAMVAPLDGRLVSRIEELLREERFEPEMPMPSRTHPGVG